MNPRQKSVILNFVFVVIVTILLVVIMITLRDCINKSEAVRVMKLLGEEVQNYHKRLNSLPPESYIVRRQVELGDTRLGNLQYRAQWIGFDASSDTILAYSQKNYRLVGGRGYIVLRNDGGVEWMDKEEFEKLLNTQQIQAETDLLQKPQRY